MRKSLLLITLVLLGTSGVRAQNDFQVIDKYQPRSILKVGLAPIGFMNHTGVSPINISLAGEFKIGNHFSTQLQLLSNLSGNISSGTWDLEYEPRFSFAEGSTLVRNKLTLNANIRYYIKGNDTFQGPYLGIRANNVIAHMEQYRQGNFFFDSEFLPTLGAYIGYQKVFKNGMFIDANIGYVPQGQGRFVKNDFDLPLDFNLTIGFRLKTGKGKEEE